MLTAREEFFAGITPATAAIGVGIELLSNDTNPPTQPVYNPTTLPLSTSNGKSYTNGVHSSLNGSATNHTTQLVIKTNGHTINKSNDSNDDEINPFSNLPCREPVDLEFKSLSLTVNLGFRKGKSTRINDDLEC